MPESEDFWNFYWDTRLQSMETLGKREALLAGSRLLRRLAQTLQRPVRVLELGCGEGQIVGALVDGHGPLCDRSAVIGVDYNPRSLARCRQDYPGWRFEEGDFTDPALLAGLGQYDLLLFVNALHEVFTSAYDPALGETAVEEGKRRVEAALAAALRQLAPGGRVLLFDGLEPPGDPAETLRIRFRDPQARAGFDDFAREYRPFRITARETGALTLNLSRRAFTRYITKSIFLGKPLWQTERLESYQYYTEDEFRAAFARQGLTIDDLRVLTVNQTKWRRLVDPPREGFPHEHIVITAHT